MYTGIYTKIKVPHDLLRSYKNYTTVSKGISKKISILIGCGFLAGTFLLSQFLIFDSVPVLANNCPSGSTLSANQQYCYSNATAKTCPTNPAGNPYQVKSDGNCYALGFSETQEQSFTPTFEPYLLEQFKQNGETYLITAGGSYLKEKLAVYQWDKTNNSIITTPLYSLTPGGSAQSLITHNYNGVNYFAAFEAGPSLKISIYHWTGTALTKDQTITYPSDIDIPSSGMDFYELNGDFYLASAQVLYKWDSSQFQVFQTFPKTNTRYFASAIHFNSAGNDYIVLGSAENSGINSVYKYNSSSLSYVLYANISQSSGTLQPTIYSDSANGKIYINHPLGPDIEYNPSTTTFSSTYSSPSAGFYTSDIAVIGRNELGTLNSTLDNRLYVYGGDFRGWTSGINSVLRDIAPSFSPGYPGNVNYNSFGIQLIKTQKGEIYVVGSWKGSGTSTYPSRIATLKIVSVTQSTAAVCPSGQQTNPDNLTQCVTISASLPDPCGFTNNVSQTQSAKTTVCLKVNGGVATIYAGDQINDNDICLPGDDNTVIESVSCNLSQRSVDLSPKSVRNTRQETTSVLHDIIIDDVRGLQSAQYSVNATMCSLVGNQATPVTYPLGYTGDGNAPLYARFNSSQGTISAIAPLSTTSAYANGENTSWGVGEDTNVPSTNSSISVFYTTASVKPGRYGLDNSEIGFELPAYMATGSYSCPITYTLIL